MRKSVLILLTLVLALFTVLVGCSKEEVSSEENGAGTSLLDRVKSRGSITVGTSGAALGFSYVQTDGSYEGFDVDFSKAIAVAVLGDVDTINWRPLSSQERLTAVQTGEVDVLVRTTTHTMGRDSIGINFLPVNFYDGQVFMVHKDSGINSLEDFEGARVAVITGTTTEMNTSDTFRKRGINYEPVVFENGDQVLAAYEQGSVDAWTDNLSYVAARQTQFTNPDDHIILDEVVSKEPLAPVVKAGDNKWYDAMKWIIYAIIQAEEFGITSENIDEFLQSEDPEIRRFLGLEGTLGEDIGLSNDFVVNIIREVGNYGEIYDRHFGPDSAFKGLERGQNELWTNGGLHYSRPFR